MKRGWRMGKIVNISCDGIGFHHSIDTGSYERLSRSHCHETYEILYVASGSGRYLVEGAEIILRPRTLMIFRPLENHCVELAGNENYERYVINFSPTALFPEARAILSRIIGDGDELGRYYSPESLSQATISVFDRIEDAAQLPDGERELYLKLLLCELVVLLSGARGNKIVHDEDELGARVAKYINSFEHDISLDKLAKIFFVSKYYLCRSFKKYSGMSVHAYINQKRVMYAKQLIDSGETASGAAYKVGFGDYSAFYRAYVKIMKRPPSMQVKKK